VVVLSMHGDEPFVLEALSAGALGYVLKDTTATELIRAIDEAAAGRRYLSPPLSDRAVEVYLRRRGRAGSSDPSGSLTDREREVLQLVAEGLTSSQIAARLGVSPRTVESHRANLHPQAAASHRRGLDPICRRAGTGGPRRRFSATQRPAGQGLRKG
jgi:DNA-binding NarL/FixJ family response regulator